MIINYRKLQELQAILLLSSETGKRIVGKASGLAVSSITERFRILLGESAECGQACRQAGMTILGRVINCPLNSI